MSSFYAYPVAYQALLIKPARHPSAPPSVPSLVSGAGFPAFAPPAPYNPPEIWSIQTLKAAQITLTTTGVGNATFAFYDPGLYIRQTVAPHSMNMMAFLCTNRFGNWGQCWLGYLDEPHYIMDPQQGETMEMVQTSTYKLFEITRQTPQDVVTLAQAYLQNVAGSTVLQYAARASGFPSSMLSIDRTADVGSGILTSIPIGDFTDPDQQTWSAPLSALLANSGLEMFTDEQGILHWRPLGYLGTKQTTAGLGLVPNLPPRPVLPDEILHCDYAESDKSVVTRVEVRWGFVPTTQTAARWTAPASMSNHLRTRILTVHAPWIQSKSAADYLAQSLGQMYSANVLIGSVTIPADPTFGIGTLVQIPSLRTDQNSSGVYYISAVTYNLEWGAPWTMTLGLSYGRAANQQFPYIGTINVPVLTTHDQAGFPNPNQILLAYSATNPQKITTPFTVKANPALANNVIQIDSNTGIGAGTVVTLQNAAGTTIGWTPDGEYTVQAAPAGSGLTVYVSNLSSLDSTSKGYLSIRQGAPVPAATTSGQSSTLGVSATNLTGSDGTGFSTISSPTQLPPVGQTPQTGTLALQALATAMTRAGQPYVLGQAGPNGWDCSGLVAWSYAQHGLTALMRGNGDVGPSGIYNYFSRHGAAYIPVSQAQPGDLLFIQEPKATGSYPDQQQGFSHVAFCQTAGGFASGYQFGADNPKTGITSLPIAGFTSYWGTPFNLALSMAKVTLSS